MINFLKHLGEYLLFAFKTPSDFATDPLKFARNQLGHGLALGAVQVWLGFPMWFIFSWYFAWEVLQYLIVKAQKHDCVADYAFYTCGVFVAMTTFPYLDWKFLLVYTLFLTSGILKRMDV